jgi:hypothetical protein
MPKRKFVRANQNSVLVEPLEPRMFLSAAPALASTSAVDFSFGKSILAGASSSSPTSLQFGPDGRLYVAQQDGIIKIYTIQRNSANHYAVTATQTISSIASIPNHTDDGTLASTVSGRLVTGLLVTGTAKNPIIYVTSSDPRIGGGANGIQTHLDTNSGIISRLTWNGSSWVKLDLVRGLPRSQENHATNGMALNAATNTLYVAQGGDTNEGAPSHNFNYQPEYALSAAILSVNLNAIGNTTYDLPTLDDQNRAGVHDANDPFGGDMGNNQAILVAGGPVQVYSPGYRNPYDLVLTSSGRLYTVDNGSNAGWGDVPIGAGGNATNQTHEPGVSYPDQLQLVTTGFYAGHPDPTRANRANTFDPKNPQSPVSIADPRQGNYLVPATQDGALTTFSNSTNGIAEYTASNFGGAMKGDLLTASLDNTVYLIGLSSDGKTAVSKQALFKNVDSAPLDVTTQGDNSAFPGTIWVADIGSGHILAFEPDSSSGKTAVDDPNLDDDGDGYSNHDEILNSTNPESSADAPADNDHDLVSNLLDGDDDNDGLPDTSDPFAIDSHNGRRSFPVMLEFGRDGLGGGGLLNMGFTGLMTNGKSDYSTLYNPSTLTAGGAAGVFTLDQVASGDAKSNNQQAAFQVGFNANTVSSDFTVHTRLLSPFFGGSAHAGQSMGFYLGTGDQDNYLKFVLSGDNGGELELLKEVGGATTIGAGSKISLAGVSEINLYLLVNPSKGSVQPQFTITRNGTTSSLVNLGYAMNVPPAWFANVTTGPAAGIIATRSSAPTFAATWGCLEVYSSPARNLTASTATVDFGSPRPGVATTRTLTLKNAGASGQGQITINSIALQGADAASFATSFKTPVTLSAGQTYVLTITCKSTHAGNLSASLLINQTGANGPLTIPLSASSTSKAFVSITPSQPSLGIDASTWEPKSFSITNKSLDGQMIKSITVDLRSSLLPDLIFTPTTAGGDDVPKDLTADSDPTAVGLSTHSYAAPLDGGYQVLQINFTNFGPGKTFLFSLDIDPSSIKGAHSPGPSGSGGISGLELTSSQWTFGFSDGSTQAGQIYRTPSSVSGGQNLFEASSEAAPVIEMLGVASNQINLTHAAHTVRINGIAGQHVQLLVTEGGLYTAGIAGGGYDLHADEDNRIIKIWETSATIGASGYVDVPVTLTHADANSGYNHIIAVVKDADGHTGPISNEVLAYYKPASTPTPPAANVLSLTLIDADNGQAIEAISDGATIDLAKLPSRNLNVRADVTAATASVLFGFDSNANDRIENVAPFALFADDNNGHYYAGDLMVGTHTITATAYAAKKAAGTAGGVLKITFTVVDSSASGT